VFDGVDRYNTDAGGGAAFLNLPSNTGVVRNLSVYQTSGVGSPPSGISPFTTEGVIPNVQAWDGVTRPDDSAYGAQR